MKAALSCRRNPRVSRRALLGGLGASAALSPFIPLLNADGQEAAPLRLILWFTPHGTIYDNWKPSGGETDFTLSPILKPLEPYRAKLNILDGLKVNADGVGAPHTKGRIFGLFLILMGIERFLVEIVRAKDDRFLGPFTIAQLISVILVVVGGWLILRPKAEGSLVRPAG